MASSKAMCADAGAFSPLVEMLKKALFTEIHLGSKPTPRRVPALASAGRPMTAHFTMEGRVTAGEHSPFAINGEDFTVGSDTWIVGDIRLGVTARIKGMIRNGRDRHATSIVVSAS